MTSKVATRKPGGNTVPNIYLQFARASSLNRYQEVLYSAVEKIVKDLEEVGVLLSGGVDSSFIAKVTYDVASRLGIRLVGYTAGLANSPDLQPAKSFAERLGITHKTRKLTSELWGGYVWYPDYWKG